MLQQPMAAGQLRVKLLDGSSAIAVETNLNKWLQDNPRLVIRDLMYQYAVIMPQAEVRGYHSFAVIYTGQFSE